MKLSHKVRDLKPGETLFAGEQPIPTEVVQRIIDDFLASQRDTDDIIFVNLDIRMTLDVVLKPEAEVSP